MAAADKGPLVLIIMDGVGMNPNSEGNAVALAHTPVLDGLFATRPWSKLDACGEAVGLMPGQMGDSNVGHLNLGAGRLVYQYMLYITREVEQGRFQKNEVLLDVIDRAVRSGGALHFMGLVSHGGVHSHSRHLFALMEMAHRAGVKNCFVHAFLDGRDVPPDSGKGYVEELQRETEKYPGIKIATVSGRYYAMDRDKRWERTALAYQAMVAGEGLTAVSGPEAVAAAYSRGETDEFVKPTVIVDAEGRPVGRIKDGDVVFFFNFRADRARQITMALSQDDFSGFARPGGRRPDIFMASLTRYDEDFTIPFAYPPQDLRYTLAEIISNLGWRQLHIAETEKWAHVTYFFNGGREEPFPGEDQVLIPSPKVATYDLKPEMSAPEVTERVLAELARDIYQVVVVNFANGDMVGHTGILSAAIKAMETVDSCIGRIIDVVTAKHGQVLVTADHGNADQMIDYETGQCHTYHSLHPVPCILVSDKFKGVRLRDGILGDVAPTVLEMLGIEQPPEMTGRSLIVK